MTIRHDKSVVALYFPDTVTERKESLIGTDESGKGDYFGPLVVAAVFWDERAAEALAGLRIRDSKLLSDRRAAVLAREIVRTTRHAVVIIGPEKYNELIARMKNLNRLLAWGHARAIENILAAAACPRAVSDQFGDEKFLNNALLEKGRRIELVQKTKAESEPAVAAASVLARNTFLQYLDKLSERAGIPLPKGAGPPVDQAAQALVGKWGKEALGQFAKLHFKNTARILG